MASPMLKEKQQPENGIPAASSRGSPSTGSYPRRGRRPRRPGNLLLPPISGKTPGPGMPGPYRAAAGKPPAVRKRPRRGQDPSLRTDPSTSARPYSAYVNYIRRAGCPPPAASSRGYRSTGSHPCRGRRPRRPGNLPSPPIPGKTPGPGMPGHYRAAVGKPHAVHNRPRRGQDPSLRTAPSTSARPYSAYVNSIRRAGCPHPAASSRGSPSTGSHPRRGRRPRRPGNLLPPPISGTPPGRACPAPTARRRASPISSINAHGGVKTPPYGPPHQRVPPPAASSRGSPSTGSHPRRGRRPRRPGNLLPPPISGTPPGRACPAPTARRRASPISSINAHGGVKTPPYGPPHQRVPAPYRGGAGTATKKPRRSLFPGLPRFFI